MGLQALGCRVDILGTNCKKLLKVKMSGGEGGVASASVRVIMSGGQQGAYCWIEKTFCRGGAFYCGHKLKFILPRNYARLFGCLCVCMCAYALSTFSLDKSLYYTNTVEISVRRSFFSVRHSSEESCCRRLTGTVLSGLHSCLSSTLFGSRRHLRARESSYALHTVSQNFPQCSVRFDLLRNVLGCRLTY